MIFPLMTQLVLPSINGLSALTIGLRLYAHATALITTGPLAPL